VVDRGRFGVEREKSICAKGWRVKGRDNLVAS